jgi:hypothetical protein
MKYVVLFYKNGNQTVLEVLGPETVIGMVADVMRGNYTNGSNNVVKIEIGNMIDEIKWVVSHD